MKKKQGFLLVYSIIDDVSFNNLKAFFDLIQEEYLSNEEGETDGKIPPIVLVGNKVDLERQRKVTTAQGQALAAQWGAKFFETRCVTPARSLRCRSYPATIAHSLSCAAPRRMRTSRILSTLSSG